MARLVFTNGAFGISGAQCGKKQCSALEYCSQFDLLCQPCSGVCDPGHHNFDEPRCTKECQTYLYQGYFKQNQIPGTTSDFREELRNIQYIDSITLSVTCLMLAILGVVLIIKIIQWKKKHHVTAWIRNKLKQKEMSKSERSANTISSQVASKPDLHLDMPPVGLQTPSINGNTPSTATTTMSRRPTEDNTLDYAYDNRAMVCTPSPTNIKPHESSL